MRPLRVVPRIKYGVNSSRGSRSPWHEAKASHYIGVPICSATLQGCVTRPLHETKVPISSRRSREGVGAPHYPDEVGTAFQGAALAVHRAPHRV